MAVSIAAPPRASAEPAQDSETPETSETPDTSETPETSETPDTPAPDGVETPEYGATIVATRSREAIVADHRAVSVIDRPTLIERAPRSTSEALHMLPGVSVQRTNHAGGSPYIRGRTGQQVLTMIDGFRLNTSIMRSGPNQYLNTIDPEIIERAEVLRGASSVLYGSDAIGGVVSLISRSPIGGRPSAGAHLRVSDAEHSTSGRGELDASFFGANVLAGASLRSFGDLRGAGPIALTSTPVYQGNTQLFTGYDEVAFDTKAVVPIDRDSEVSAAFFGFRQLDAPRTDKCKPDPLDCRFFDEQFYDLGYLRYRGAVAGLRDVELGAAVARTHERRSRIRQELGQIDRERDRVLTFALTGRASAPTRRMGSGAARLSFGGELYLDSLASEAAREETGTGTVTPEVRGKYIDGSRYGTAAGFAFGELVFDRSLSFTGGARVTAVRAQVAADPESGTRAFVQSNVVPVVGMGARVALSRQVTVLANAEQAFRAPNLDDLTARSSEGPGFQVANADLQPERAVSFDLGVRVRHPRVFFEVFAFDTHVRDSITRAPIACPPSLEAQCGSAANVYGLVNAESAYSRGVEVTAQLPLPTGLRIASTFTYTFASTVVTDMPDQPLSKIPPLWGQIAVRHDFRKRRYFWELIASWARRQDRLSVADRTDARIPVGGTPGYGVIDVRAGARLSRWAAATLTIQNLTDSPYRIHGSGVDGAGFGVILSVAGNTATL